VCALCDAEIITKLACKACVPLEGFCAKLIQYVFCEAEYKACVLCVTMNVNLVCPCKNESKTSVVQYKT
jgi:hypothetical protein